MSGRTVSPPDLDDEDGARPMRPSTVEAARVLHVPLLRSCSRSCMVDIFCCCWCWCSFLSLLLLSLLFHDCFPFLYGTAGLCRADRARTRRLLWSTRTCHAGDGGSCRRRRRNGTIAKQKSVDAAEKKKKFAQRTQEDGKRRVAPKKEKRGQERGCSRQADQEALSAQ
ncbi:hypothetical protein TW95_gp1680 [Pandoravirus inopinatum]|uniref:Uncharacterized protein n=1 Tax=Pandoravirus inopinatum TaxID=1605721 RepID=A0A0B5J459_9VIRU|nr:hypothetical protein TW95_gp1680 [Pandoravirus inopinatum]AJF98414.1 hypothetical protein [Pandoravirus inopinatum]